MNAPIVGLQMGGGVVVAEFLEISDTLCILHCLHCISVIRMAAVHAAAVT